MLGRWHEVTTCSLAIYPQLRQWRLFLILLYEPTLEQPGNMNNPDRHAAGSKDFATREKS